MDSVQWIPGRTCASNFQYPASHRVYHRVPQYTFLPDIVFEKHCFAVKTFFNRILILSLKRRFSL